MTTDSSICRMSHTVQRQSIIECRWEAPGPENMILATTEIMLTDAVQQGKNAGKLVTVKFFAPWCQACKALYPKWTQLAAQNPDVTFIKVG